MKKLFFLVNLLGIAYGYSQAQTIVTESVQAGQQKRQHSTTHLEARNSISIHAIAIYTANESISLQPGFVAQSGSVFSAYTSSQYPMDNETDNPLALSAYPNPFSERSSIRYSLSKPDQVSHTLTNLQGQIVRYLAEKQEVGQHQFDLLMGDLPNGTYIYHVQTSIGRRAIRLIKQP